MKLAIVDDDPNITKLLSQYVEKYVKQYNLIIKTEVFHNPNDFLTSYNEGFDLVILDIEMPGLNGIETARELRRIDPSVILMFVTNMAQYALQGYEVEAIDYAIKPVTYADFALKLQKAFRYIQRNHDKKVVIHTQEGIVSLKMSDIFYIEVVRHYLIYHTLYGEYKVRGVMKEVEKQFQNHHFVRSNHCYLINLKYVVAIEGNEARVQGHALQISRSKKKDFMLAFTRYMGGLH